MVKWFRMQYEVVATEHHRNNSWWRRLYWPPLRQNST